MSKPNWVVRGGMAAPKSLQDGYDQHLGAPSVFGFSVQYQPGLTIEQLADAGRFRNSQISYAADAELITTARNLGYDLSVVKTPGRGFHHTVTAQLSTTGEVVQKLPDDLALALSSVFKQKPNPFGAL